MTTEPTVAEANKRAAEIVARAEAVADALDIATRHNMRDKMQAFLTPEVRALPATEILAKARTFALANLPDNKPITAPYIHTASDEPDNVMVAIRGLAGFDTRNRSFGAMVERSQELARTYGNPRGMYVPMEAFLPATRATQLASDHPALLPSVSLPGMLVEGLRPYNACLALGAKLLQLGENSYIPGISALNGDWYADDEGAPDQTPVTRSIPLTLHRHTTRVKWGYTLAKIGNPAVDGMTKQQLLASMMGAVDVAAIQGAGTPGDAPKGILNTAGVGVVSLGGGELDWEAIIALQTAIFAEGVTGQQFGFGYLSSHLVREKLLTTLKSTGISGYLMEADTSEPTVAGFKAAFTSNCPNSLIFGNWSDTIVAQFGSPDVVVDPYTESAKGNVAITVHSGWDIGVRHAESFAYIEDALAS